MQTNIIAKYIATPNGKEADAILGSCVHCGFCTATCPTYQLLGDELDGPRGRIYLIKQVLEGNSVTKKTQTHLDRCLTCRSCETTCPSGVRYGRLIDIGRHIVEKEVGRSVLELTVRKVLRTVIPNTRLFSSLLNLGRFFSAALPASLKAKIPAQQPSTPWPANSQARKMLVLDGCVQPVTTPNTNAVAARVLDKLGIELIRAAGAGCCGAVSHHLSAHEEGLGFMRRNIDVWWPYVQQGVEAIVMTASGCGVVVKDYGKLLEHDSDYAEKAKTVSGLCKDLSEVLFNEKQANEKVFNEKLGIQNVAKNAKAGTAQKVAFHSPCTLQHGQQITASVEKILADAGYRLTKVIDPHLCCGSAGTYSILQADLSQALLTNKLKSLQCDSPDIIATANVGCQMHMATKANVPVKHWIELLDR